MSNILDFGPIYTQTGNLLQMDYAQKCADSGSTCIGIKTKTGVVLAVEKPIISPLHLGQHDKRIKQVAPNCLMVYTGLLSDGGYIYQYVKDGIYSEAKDMEEEEVSPGVYKRVLSENLNIFGTYMGCRPIGCNFMSAIAYRGEFKLLGGDPTSKTSFYKGYAMGKGAQRAKTELEKLDFDNLGMQDAIDSCVRIMYKSYDPLKDKEFEVEMGCISVDTGYLFKEISCNDLGPLIEKYKDISIDGE
jgi:20S proteasome subunit alpha 7